MNKDLRAKIEAKTAEAVQNLADAMLTEALTDPMRAEMSALYHMGEPGVFFTLQALPDNWRPFHCILFELPFCGSPTPECRDGCRIYESTSSCSDCVFCETHGRVRFCRRGGAGTQIRPSVTGCYAGFKKRAETKV